MTKDEQARQRLVEIAMETVEEWEGYDEWERAWYRDEWRRSAGFKNPQHGHFCAAGLTDAMKQAGLSIPAPGTPARRGAIALLDWVFDGRSEWGARRAAAIDHPVPRSSIEHAKLGDIIAWLQHPPPDPKGWRRGHVAVIVATDSESITTVGWNEGPSPGRVMMRRLWRDPGKTIERPTMRIGRPLVERVPPIHTVLWRRPGGLYGIARPVAA